MKNKILIMCICIDLYSSTHSSSNYSPSISEDIETSNSLIHHHHLHHHSKEYSSSEKIDENIRKHYQQQQKQHNDNNHEVDDDNDDINKTTTTENNDNKVNDEIMNSYNNERAEKLQYKCDNRNFDEKNHNNGGFRRSIINNDDNDDNGDGDGNIKIPLKLRKIDKDLKKLEKKTSESIKSGSTTGISDGSYQCQFCDKSFPRLGYLKKHEQVSMYVQCTM